MNPARVTANAPDLGDHPDQEDREDLDADLQVIHSKRPRSPNDDGDDEPNAKQKIKMDELPWVIQDVIEPFALSPELRKTLNTLENIARDPKRAKSSLLLSPHCPPFPDSQWTQLLAGRSIDLNHVFSGLYSVSHDSRQTEKLGDMELAFGISAPTRHVQTHGDWVIAFDALVDATKFVFPHRAHELSKYSRHIRQLFASFPEKLHLRIIHYDRAVQLRISQAHNLLLTDFAEFADIHALWIHNGGSGGSTQSLESAEKKNSSSTGATRQRVACRRWNEGKCPNTSKACDYLHHCNKCDNPNHTAPECTK